MKKRSREDTAQGANKKACKKNSCLEGWEPPRTALEIQFMEQKVLYPDTLVAVECGYKYKFFGRDAQIAGEILGFYINPNEKAGGTYCSCSFPVQRLEVNTRRLINNGYRVAHLAQAETNALRTDAGTASGKLFERTITGLYTKATMILANDAEAADDGYQESDANNLLLITETLIPPKQRSSNEQVAITVLCISLTTGGVLTWDSFKDGPLRRELMSRLLHFDPVEVLASSLTPPSLHCVETLGLNHGVTSDPSPTKPGSVRYQLIPTKDWAPECQTAYVESFYSKYPDLLKEVQALSPAVQGCLGILVSYLKLFDLQEFLFTRCAESGSSFSRFTGAGCMSLPSTTLRNLEVFTVMGDQAKRTVSSRVRGSLNWVMNHCKTGFGARRLRRWLSRPLMDKAAIEGRHSAVHDMARGAMNVELNEYKNKALSNLPDIEKILTKMTYGKARPKEYCTFLKTVLQVVKMHTTLNVNSYVKNLSPLLQTLLDDKNYEEVEKIANSALASINQKAAADNNTQELFITENISHEGLKNLTTSINEQHSLLEHHLFEVRDILRQPSLAYKTVSGVEFLIDVPQAAVKLVPKTWKVESKVAKSTRYHTPVIKECIHKIQVAKDTMAKLSMTVFAGCQKEFTKKHVRPFQSFIDSISVLDALYSLATLAKEEGWCRPEMLESGQCLEVVDGRHPVIDRLLKEQDKSYVANDVLLNAGKTEQVMIVTGPNMGGKSSYLRQVAVTVLLAQVGSFVPATSAKLSVFDGIYVRLGSHDSLLDGQSSFLVEISETADILQAATAKSLLVLDELGRGTSTFDGIALANSLLEWLITKVGCFTLFVTHYPELLELAAVFRTKIKTCHMSFTHSTDAADPQNVSFLYKLVAGVSPSSFGMNVARLAGIPSSIISVATDRAAYLKTRNDEARSEAKVSLNSVLSLVSIVEHLRTLISLGATPDAFAAFKESIAYIDTTKMVC
eukprot:TRINITY_DN10327_c0_g1_i1.p1 TRINITY_DN10327_c0_g1~~TRINITY_DN10327_c0_g1_i1.p1  ORF type:complete len:978 (+),score=219.90 TRINITY_DN10327_c0_g1_i1:41-2935(+)